MAQVDAQIMAQFNSAMAVCFNPGGGVSPDERRQADKWLQHFQQTPAAWEICNGILVATPALSAEVCFFAANTLHNKVCYDFQELSPESQSQLHDSMSSHLMRHGLAPGASRALLKRLCLASAALAVQMNGRDILVTAPQLIDRAEPTQKIEVTKLVLELMGSLPEECNSRRINVSDDVRNAFQTSLDQSTQMLLTFLSQTVARPEVATSPDTLEAVLGCLGSWVRYSYITADALASQSLLTATLDLIASESVPESLFETGVDTLVEVLRRYGATEQNMPLVQVMVPRIMALRVRLAAAMAMGEDGLDTSRGLCRLFTEMGESYLDLILSPQPLGQDVMVNLLLMCNHHHDLDIATIPAHFWYRFVKGWRQLDDENVKAKHQATFTPIMTELVVQSVRLLKYPEDIDEFTSDEKDDFRNARSHLCETIYDCSVFLSSISVMSQLWQVVGTEWQNVAQGNWAGLEAVLFAMKSLVKETQGIRDCDELFSQMIQMLIQLSTLGTSWESAPRLRHCACQVMGTVAAWLQRSPAQLSSVFTFLYTHLLVKETAGAAAAAIRSICERCASHLGEPVLSLYDEIKAAAPAHFDHRDELTILDSMGFVVKVLPLDVARRAVKRLLEPSVARLQALAAGPNADGSTSRAIVQDLDRIVSVARPLKMKGLPVGEAHPLLEILQAIWPSLDSILNKYKTSESMAEKVCRCYKFILRSCQQSFAPCLEALMTHLLRHFDTSPFSAYLYSASICITEFGESPAHEAMLYKMLEQFSTTVFRILSCLDHFVAHPDMVEEYFFLVGRFLEYCPTPLLPPQSQLSISIVQCGLVGLKLEHREAHAGILSAIEQLIGTGLISSSGTNKPSKQQIAGQLRSSVEQVLAQVGEPLVKAVVESLVGMLPAYGIDDGKGTLAGVLWKLSLFDPQILSNWFGTALALVDMQIVDANQRAGLMEAMGRAIQGRHESDFFNAIGVFSSQAHRNSRRIARSKGLV